jgi:cytochrome c biogenesis protein ResB
MMRVALALLTVASLAACGGAQQSQSQLQSQSEHALVRYDDEWRQRQAELDAQAIMQGMAQARQRAEQTARSAR